MNRYPVYINTLVDKCYKYYINCYFIELLLVKTQKKYSISSPFYFVLAENR